METRDDLTKIGLAYRLNWATGAKAGNIAAWPRETLTKPAATGSPDTANTIGICGATCSITME